MGNSGKWDEWYAGLNASDPSAFRYGDTVTYRLGAEFLSDCKTVEDWGAGAGGFQRFRPDALGVDGSRTPFATKTADLTCYRSACDGIFMRHVLEHNADWPLILGNALASARQKLCVVLFTPFVDGATTDLGSDKNRAAGVHVHDFSLSRTEFYRMAENMDWAVTETTHSTDTAYGVETMLYLTKRSHP